MVKVIEVDLDSDDESDEPDKGSSEGVDSVVHGEPKTAEAVGATAEAVGATMEAVGAAKGIVESRRRRWR